MRILRIAYAKSPRSTAPLEGLPPPCGPLSPPLQLRCKTFVPAQLTRGFLVPEFESLSATKRRVEAWISATGEACPVRPVYAFTSTLDSVKFHWNTTKIASSFSDFTNQPPS